MALYNKYAIRVANSDAVLKNVKVLNAEAGILVESSKVTLDGSVDVSNNKYTGIEICKEGSGDPNLAINGELVNTTECLSNPTILGTGVKDCISCSSPLSNITTSTSEGEQTLYFINDCNEYYAEVSSYEELISAWKITNKIRAIADFELENTVIHDSESLILDLNGKTLTFNMPPYSVKDVSGYPFAFDVRAGGSFVLEDSAGTGIIDIVGFDGENKGWTDDSRYSKGAAILSLGKFTMNGGTIKLGNYCAYALSCHTSSCEVELNGGTIDASWKVSYDDGTVDGGIGIITSGNKSCEGFKITINDGFILKSANTALSLQSFGETIINGGEIDSVIGSAIEIKAGKLRMNNGTITSNVARKTDVTANPKAIGEYAAALVIVKPESVSDTVYNGNIYVKVSDGTLNNKSGDAICVVHEAPIDYIDTQKVVVYVSAGSLNGGQNIQSDLGVFDGDVYLAEYAIKAFVME